MVTAVVIGIPVTAIRFKYVTHRNMRDVPFLQGSHHIIILLIGIADHALRQIFLTVLLTRYCDEQILCPDLLCKRISFLRTGDSRGDIAELVCHRRHAVIQQCHIFVDRTAKGQALAHRCLQCPPGIDRMILHQFQLLQTFASSVRFQAAHHFPQIDRGEEKDHHQEKYYYKLVFAFCFFHTQKLK